MSNSRQLGEEKILKLLLRFSIPAIIGMLVNALYNVVDRIFVGNGVGSVGIAGITIAFPIMTIMMAFQMLIGIGANALVSIRLGQNRKEDAEKIIGNSVTLLIASAIGLAIVGTLFLDPILKVFGASQEVLPYAREYIRIILWAGIFQSIGFGMNHFIRSEGNPKVAMFTMLIGAVVNTILDPIFIFVFGWGMAGAAIATGIAQAVSAAWVLYHFLSGRSSLRLRSENLKLDLPIVKDILALGSSHFAMQLASSVLNVVMNTTLITYGGDIAVSGMGVVMSLNTLILMPIFGINQGAQPIIGYNYGAEKYDRVKETLKLAILGATLISTLGFIGTRLYPSQMVAFFNSEDIELINFGSRALITFMGALPIIGFQIVSASYFQAVGKPKHATTLSLSRQVLLLIPALIILPRFWGMQGALISGPTSDIVSSIITAVFITREMKDLGFQHEASIRTHGFKASPLVQTRR